MEEILESSPSAWLRQLPWLPFVLVGANYFRGGTTSHVIALVGIAVCLVLWTGYFPRRLVLDDEGFAVSRVLLPTRRVRWADVDHFEPFGRGGFTATYTSWYDRDHRDGWWKRSGDGWILPAFPRADRSGTMSAAELSTFLNDRLLRRLGTR